jgi:hypothetical protein
MKRTKPGIGADFEIFLNKKHHNLRIKKVKDSSPRILSA